MYNITYSLFKIYDKKSILPNDPFGSGCYTNILNIVLVNTVWKTCLATLQKSSATVSLKQGTFFLISNTACIKVSCTVKCVRSMLQEQTIYQKIKIKLIQNIFLLNKSTYCSMLIALHIK